VVCAREAGARQPLEYRFKPLAAAAAGAWLRRVVTSLLTRDHGYLLPCEAAFRCRLGRDAPAPGAYAAALAEVQSPRRGRVSYSSTYGPVRLLERYGPPAEAEAQAMIEERFGAFFELLEDLQAAAAPAPPPGQPARPARAGTPAKPRGGRRS
jgi:hypothetical protein